jgi:hypothetical protein
MVIMNQIFCLIFVFGTYLLAFLCLGHAWKRGQPVALHLLVAIAYGILMEYITILTWQIDPRSEFQIMTGYTIPLAIGTMRGVILYAAIETANRLEMPEFVRLGFTALLALSIGFNLDMIAIRLGFWTWPHTQVSLWGVPLHDFYNWILIAFSFSLISYLGKWALRFKYWGIFESLVFTLITPLLAALTFFGLIAGQSALMGLFRITDSSVLLSVVVGGFAIALAWFARRSRQDHAIDGVILTVPLFFHLFCLAALFLDGFYQPDPTLIVVIVATFIVSMGLFVLPSARMTASPTS